MARVCETRRVYGLLTGADAWLVWGDEDQDRDVFPAWPHPRLALAAAGDEFEGFVAGSTGLDEFLDFCDVLQADGLLVGVMPYPDGSQLVVEPADLRRDLEDFVDGVYDDVFG